MEEAPVPPQYKPQPIVDFRDFPDGPRGYKVSIKKNGTIGSKRKLDEYEEQVAREQLAMEQGDGPPQVVGTAKRYKKDTTGVGKVSGRDWKLPGRRAGELKTPTLSSTWEKKMSDKASLAAFTARKRDAKAAFKAQKAEAHKRREESKARKEANRKKSEIVQRVSSATAKRMLKSKKQRKLLKSGDG